MRYLIIPDVHLRWKWAEEVIEKHQDVDKIIFLGDYFDHFTEDYNKDRTTEQTAIWLKDSLQNPKRIHLIGNHDAYYMYGTCFGGPKVARGSGYEPLKNILISQKLSIDDWDRLQWYYYIQDGNWLISHAGLAETYCYEMYRWEILEFLKASSLEATKALKDDDPHWFYNAGRARGGIHDKGGLIWLDFNKEFKPLKEINQIVGHSFQGEGMWKQNGENYCLDGGQQTYAILESGELDIKIHHS